MRAEHKRAGTLQHGAAVDHGDAAALGDAYENAERLPVVSTYPCERSFRLPDDFSTAKYRGLLFCAVVDGRESAYVHACWKNQESVDANESAFTAHLQLEACGSTGAVAQLVTTPNPWWKRHSLTIGKAILGLAALFGALTAIRDYFADLFLPPYISAYVNETTPVDYPEKSRLIIPIKILNYGRFGRAIVTLKGATLQSKTTPAESIPLEVDTHQAPISPGQIVEAHLVGAIPALKRHAGPQNYDLDVSMAASAGYFAGSRSPEFQKRTFQIWPDLGWQTAFNPIPTNREIAYITLTIYTGRAIKSGATGYLLSDVPEPPDRVELVCCNATATSPITSAGPNYRFKLEFRTGTLQAFQTSVEQVAIAFKRNLKPAEWDTIARSIKVQVEGGGL